VPPPRVAAPGHPGGGTVAVDVHVVVPVEREPVPVAVPMAMESPPPMAVPPPPAATEERISAVTLPAPTPLVPAHRSFFDGDWLRLELLVVDARTGEVRWTKTVTDDVDVRDAHKVRGAIDDALANAEGWSSPMASAP
jgi:outer membrane protein assembly factor BamB